MRSHLHNILKQLSNVHLTSMSVASKYAYVLCLSVLHQTLLSLGNIMHLKEIHSMISRTDGRVANMRTRYN